MKTIVDDQSVKLKPVNISHMHFEGKLPKFNDCQIFPLYGIYIIILSYHELKQKVKHLNEECKMEDTMKCVINSYQDGTRTVD